MYEINYKHILYIHHYDELIISEKNQLELDEIQKELDEFEAHLFNRNKLDEFEVDKLKIIELDKKKKEILSRKKYKKEMSKIVFINWSEINIEKYSYSIKQ